MESMSEKRVCAISANAGGRAEEVLRLIAGPPWAITNDGYSPPSNRRVFEQVDDAPTQWAGSVCVAHAGGHFTVLPLSLRLGDPDMNRFSLHLQDAVHSTTWSCKPVGMKGHMYVLNIGSRVPESRLPSIANNIVGCWVIHGFNWCDKKKRVHHMPYGPSSNGAPRQRRRRRYRNMRGPHISWYK